MAGLLGLRPSRHFKIFREEFPAIFRFNGNLYQEHYNIDTDSNEWIEVSEDDVIRWTGVTRPGE